MEWDLREGEAKGVLAVVNLYDNSISLYVEGDPEPVAVIRLEKIIIHGEQEE
ncbi:hypothetical protein Adeg_0017 [Ammonifex degensii KC4]|uniref:Uncharacterized protein n=1 Tax=Ammonifex degensii (strain DSM 10501 / KC4) TaxID=429009 RepID=C9RA85_AMMDK|nr:hypothetical protein [Ammonifex degensii]ACX51194.1 hypothetical protein Adeg_0017 [Ammonifex degensii KC4]